MTDTRVPAETQPTGVARPAEFPFGSAPGLDPAPEYQRLRAEEPVAKVTLPTGDSAWLVTRYEDARIVFSDTRFSRAAASRPGAPRLMPGVEGDPDSIVSKDPPDHTRLRRLVSQAFIPRRIEAMRPGIENVANQLLNAMEAAGAPADLVSLYASPLPITVICDLLGIPPEDRNRFRTWSRTMFTTSPEGLPDALAARASLLGYLRELVEARRREPTDDLLGVLITARDEGDRLSEGELVSFAGGLVVAGYETTANRLGNSVLTLLLHPDQLGHVRDNPDALAPAVEEMLRFTPGGAAGGLMRVATEDVHLGGALIRAGDGVIAVTGSANRDADVFEDPDRFDVTRPVRPHLTFGHGFHHCVGASLARVELQVGIAALLRRFPGLRLAVPETELTWRNGVVILSLAALPIAW